MASNALTLSNLELETAAVSISIAAGCEPCTRFHLLEATRLGATDAVLLRATLLSGTLQKANRAAATATDRLCPESDFGRQSALAAIGVAVCTNGVNALRDAIAAARELGINDTDIMALVGLAARIKEKAASHLDRVIGRLDADAEIAWESANLCQ